MKIKTVFIQIKNLLRRGWQWIAGEAQMLWAWVRNLFFVFLTTKSEPRVFYGYGHWWFAKKYADRRSRISRINKFCGGKRHYVLPYGEYSLIVLNRLELENGKSRGLFNREINIYRVLKSAYYVTNDKGDENK